MSRSSLLLPKHGLGERDLSQVVMVCDHPGCRMVPDRAPCIVIPSRTPELLGHAPIRIMTTVHFCQPHATWDAFDVQTWLTSANKRRVEDTARRIRPRDFKPDFEGTTMNWELVTTPEYRSFLQSLGIRRVFTAQ